MEVFYVGVRTGSGCHVFRMEGHDVKKLEPRLDVHSHSPTGFEWGYCGSGPAQLALALMLDAFGRSPQILQSYHEIMRRMVIHLPHEVWKLQQSTLRDFAEFLWAGEPINFRDLPTPPQEVFEREQEEESQ